MNNTFFNILDLFFVPSFRQKLKSKLYGVCRIWIPTFAGMTLFIFSLTYDYTAQASENSPDENADIQYSKFNSDLLRLKKEFGAYKITLFEENNKRSLSGLSKKDRKNQKLYLSTRESYLFWTDVYNLKNDLFNLYNKFNSNQSEEDIQAISLECNNLALALIKGTHRLKKEYKIGTFPLVHNLFIGMKLKKRGACKHWAEDLLAIINTVDHPHFTSYWGEAHPHKVSEHNVAILTPKNATFMDGILIDPWRTAGKPYWVQVKKDNHPWNSWSGYEPR